MTTPAMTGKDRAMRDNSAQAALHDELRADIAAARRERDEAREAQEYAELQLAYLANEMVFNGNSIGWIASKADNYKAALGRAWSALTESGGKCDGNTELAEAIRQHFAALSMPASEAVAFVEQTAPEGLYARFVDAGNMDTVGPGTKLFATPQPAPAAHAGGEAVACVRREALNFVSDSFLFPPHMADAGDVLLYTHPSPMTVDALLEKLQELREEVSVQQSLMDHYQDWDDANRLFDELTALLSGGAAREDKS